MNSLVTPEQVIHSMASEVSSPGDSIASGLPVFDKGATLKE